MTRHRPRFTAWPKPHIAWTNTPDPNCQACQGTGEVEVPDLDHESATTEYCHCWNPADTRQILPLSGWISRLFFGWQQPRYSDEAPF